MTSTLRLQSITRLFIAALAMAGVAITLVVANPAEAAGLRNCVEIPEPPQAGRVGCYEQVWVDGVEVRMTFANQTQDGRTPRALDPFYVLAPQTSLPQGYPPNTFAHDHVVRAVPAHNRGAYSVRLQGHFVLCSGDGLATGACAAAWTSIGGPNPLPFAQTVNGQPLTSAGAIEAAATAGHLALVNLGPGAVLIGTVSGR